MWKDLYAIVFVGILIVSIIGKIHKIGLGNCKIDNKPTYEAMDIVINTLLLIGFLMLFYL